MGRVGVTVQQLDRLLRARHERIEHAVADQHGAHWDGTVCQPLGAGDEVRQHAEILGCERRAEAAEAGDNLVENQQDAVPVADSRSRIR